MSRWAADSLGQSVLLMSGSIRETITGENNMKLEIWGCYSDEWIQIMKIINGVYVTILRTRAENYGTVRQAVEALAAMD